MEKYSFIFRWMLLSLYLYNLLIYAGVIPDAYYVFSKNVLEKHKLDFNNYWYYFTALALFLFLMEYFLFIKKNISLAFKKTLGFTCITLMVATFIAQLFLATIFSIPFWILFLYKAEFFNIGNIFKKAS
jgi:hypothetical protein